MLNRDMIGRTSEVRTVTVEHGQLKLFAKAIGEVNPVYFDTKAAQAAGHPDILAPATFGNCLRLLAPAKSLTYDDIGLDYKKLLHAEEKMDYIKPFHAGDKLSLVTEVADMYDKKGGALEFVVMATRISNQKGEAVQNAFTTVVMRHG